MWMICPVLTACGGAVIGSFCACMPGLHVYNLLAWCVMCVSYGIAPDRIVMLAPLWAGLVTSFSIVGNVPSVLLAAPDESAMFTVAPGQKMLFGGRGQDAVLLSCLGAAGGLLFVLLVGAPAAMALLPKAWPVLQPHMHWVIWCVTAFMLMSEWPRQGSRGQGGYRRLLDGWRSTGAGLMTFGMAGLLGLLLFHCPMTAPDAMFQSLMPAFTGLFTIPWLVMNSISGVAMPEQLSPMRTPCGRTELTNGLGAGCLGGAFAALVPAITGGIGGFLAGHATSLRNDKSFLVSQGASRAVYYVGGLMLFFVPGGGLCRGGAAAMLESVCEPVGHGDFLLFLGAAAISGGIALGLTPCLSAWVTALAMRWGYRQISILTLCFVLTIVIAMTGLVGLAVAAVAAGIGLIPPLYGARRMNCLGVILVPVGCSMSGLDPFAWCANILR